MPNKVVSYLKLPPTVALFEDGLCHTGALELRDGYFMPHSKPQFIPGLELCEGFFRDSVQPVLRKHFGPLRYAAALIASGSEVLGFDTELSSDHHWGPRVMIFLKPDDVSACKQEISKKLSEYLPRFYRGYPTSFSAPEEHGVQLLDYSENGPINHRVEIMSLEQFFDDYLGFDISQDIQAVDWLSFPGQKLRSITGGRVFHDDIGLNAARQRFAYYPEDVWLYLLACGWTRIEQEEHLMGRAGSVGDEIGAGIIAARLVRDLMNLCFLMEKQYAPYPKWFGTAFAKLQCAEVLEPLFRAVLSANTWQERERHLSPAYEFVAARHNSLQITDAMPDKVRSFHDRPFDVISMGVFSKAICERISRSQTAGGEVRTLVRKPLIGCVEQFCDSTDILSNTNWRPGIRNLYGAGE